MQFLVSRQHLNDGLKFSVSNEKENDNKKTADMKGRYEKIHPLWKKMFTEHCWIVIDSPHVNEENSKLYNALSKRLQDSFARPPACNYCFVGHIQLYMYYVLQMRENESKYGFYCQNPAHFPWIFKFFIDNSSISLKQCLLGEFHGQKLETY